MTSWFRVCLAFGLIASWSGPALASLVMALDLPELATRADGIVVGEIVSVESRWNRRRDRILTHVEVQVAESWKGQHRVASRITVVQPGGSLDGLSLHVHGTPAFAPGERAVLFLRGQDPSSLATLGMAQGKRLMRWSADTKGWWVDPGDRSAAVLRDARGLLAPASPEPGMPLDELRRRVKAMVRP
jgi:hypothetical protein